MRAALGPPVLCLTLVGCAAELSSNELVSARNAYEEANVSRAALFSQERLAAARQALDRAEGAHLAAPGTPEARTLAYVALRRAELAKLSGDYEYDRHVVAELHEQRREKPASVAPTAVAPAASEESAAPASDTTAHPEAAEQAAELLGLTGAVAGMEPLVTSKSSAERTVLTLDSSFVFAPKKPEIVASAHEKLDRIAGALVGLGEAASISVVGHTDSAGADASNLALSKQRADALRTYLIGRGVVADRVRAEGRGEEAPIAPNETAEGRALNRRIEIVVARTVTP